MRKAIFATIAFLSLISLSAPAQRPAVTLPEFLFFKPDQSSFSNRDLEAGKSSFFVFFDPDCAHCQRAVGEISRHYPDLKKTPVYLISLDDKVKVNAFMRKYGGDLITKKNVVVLQDRRDELTSKFGEVRYPSMFLYSAEGKLILYENNEDNLFRVFRRIGTGPIK